MKQHGHSLGRLLREENNCVSKAMNISVARTHQYDFGFGDEDFRSNSISYLITSYFHILHFSNILGFVSKSLVKFRVSVFEFIFFEFSVLNV